MSEAPPFWFEKPGAAAWALSPLGAIYGYISSRRMLSAHKAVSQVPIICIGNFIAGGAGKTPTAVAIAKIAREMGLRPGFLSRGFGGHIKAPTVVDIRSHNATDVGDEPLILGLYGTTVVSPDRPAGVKLLEEQGVDLILMDDGFQNPSLYKDFSLVVVDSSRGIGNGFCIPAGPMRAPLKQQLALTSALLIIGQSGDAEKTIRAAARMAKPILSAKLIVRNPDDLAEDKVLAYAGIADTSKFFRSLESIGAEIVERQTYPDHHIFTAEECQNLLAKAKAQNLTLVTTEKDSVRLVRMGETHQELRAASKVLNVDLVFENQNLLEGIITQTISKASEYRMKIFN